VNHWLQILGSMSMGLCILLGSYVVLSQPSGAPSLLGPRGLRRARSLANNALWAQLEPTVRWLATRIRPLMPQRLRSSLDRQLTLAGDFWGLQPEEFAALSVLTATAGLGLGTLYGLLLERGALYVALGGGLGMSIPYLQISGLEQERRRRVQNGLPYVIDLLSLGLSAGLDFPGALRHVVEKASAPDDPLVEELHLILQELEVGKTRKAALTQFAERNPGEAVREFVGAIVQAEERGNPLAHVLQIQADASRQRRSVRAEEAASRASLQILLPMVLVFVAILLLIVTPMAFELQHSFGDGG
jgi:tight adherence protein C